MQATKRLIITGLLLGFSLSVYAQQETLVSRSAGKLIQDVSVELMTEVQKQDPVISPTPVQNQTRDTTATQGIDTQTVIANRHDQLFSIYDASVALLSDIDADGYHHAINVSFDVDVSYDSATVYAKLYLSRDGGPWSQYHTTDMFNIFGNNFSDAYEVTTELLEGYPPGFYDILIEVFSLNHAGMVASKVLDYNYLGRDVLLEDLSRDEGIFVEEVSFSHGAGSFSLIWLLLVFQVVIAARSANSLAPGK